MIASYINNLKPKIEEYINEKIDIIKKNTNEIIDAKIINLNTNLKTTIKDEINLEEIKQSLNAIKFKLNIS